MSDQLLRLLPSKSGSVREEKRVGGKEDKEEMELLRICNTDREGRWGAKVRISVQV